MVIYLSIPLLSFSSIIFSNTYKTPEEKMIREENGTTTNRFFKS